MDEIWKDIFYTDIRNNETIDFRGKYQVSNLGNVRNVRTNKILKPRKDKDGYLDISLKRRHFRIHRLVAEMFIENPNEYDFVNHKDEVVSNNTVENLEWCTCYYNNNYGNRNKEISKTIIGVNIENGDIVEFYGMREAERNGFNHANISECCNGNRKTHKGYKWYYLDDYLNMTTLSEADMETIGTCND